VIFHGPIPPFDKRGFRVHNFWATCLFLAKYGWTSVSAAGSVAWAATDVAFKFKAGGHEMALPARGTFVFEKRGEEWLIAQAHFSFPTAGQGEGASIPT
jgi:SnoaL-like domain